jgi:glucose/mannose-6-phosphate isomerase
MLRELKLWPQKIREGLDIAHNFHFEHSKSLPKNVKKIVFFGMGGSGISGRIIKTFFDQKKKIPTFIVDSPQVPAFVDSDTLAVVVSYSGNTWETVEALRVLATKFIPTIVLSHGGKAVEIAEAKNIPFLLLPDSKTPRSSLGTVLGILLGLFDLMGLINGKEIVGALQEQVKIYIPKFEDDKSYFDDFIKYVGKSDYIHIWGVSGDSAAFAYRAQTQFNENSKIQAVTSIFPELCHNLMVGFTKFEEKPKIIFFFTKFLSTPLELTIEATEELLKSKGVAVYNPPVLGDTWEQELFHIIIWSDFASYYLGQSRGVETAPVKIIDELKKKHTEKGIK